MRKSTKSMSPNELAAIKRLLIMVISISISIK